MLAEFKLIPGLNNLFDKLIWRKHPSGHVLHRQNQNCDCSPVRSSPSLLSYLNDSCIWMTMHLFSPAHQEISFKIQFLRLLQSFSDHHE